MDLFQDGKQTIACVQNRIKCMQKIFLSAAALKMSSPFYESRQCNLALTTLDIFGKRQVARE